MKFSDMMGKGNKAAVDEAEATETALTDAQSLAPPVPEAPIRFGANRTGDAVAPVPADAAVAPPVIDQVVSGPSTEPSIADVMNELAPRPNVAKPTATATAAPTAASVQELDASAWLEGLTVVDDDLLPS